MSEIIKVTQPQLQAIALDKTYRTGQHDVSVLRGVNLTVQQGEFLSIVGKSGSGKSTLLHLIGLLDSPDIGEVRFEGRRIDHLPATARDQLRNHVFGFVFQFYHLLPELNLLENVLSPLMIRYSTWDYWRQRRELKHRACEMIQRVGLEHRLKHKPSQMSGGEMQRAAIARALVAEPQVLLADEPTGNLDQTSGNGIVELLEQLNSEQKLSIIMVTHEEIVAQRAQRIVRLHQGQIKLVNGQAA